MCVLGVCVCVCGCVCVPFLFGRIDFCEDRPRAAVFWSRIFQFHRICVFAPVVILAVVRVALDSFCIIGGFRSESVAAIVWCMV